MQALATEEVEKVGKVEYCGPIRIPGLFQTTGETCAKFGSDRFRNVDLYKVQTNIHSFLYIILLDLVSNNALLKLIYEQDLRSITLSA